jgi:hypothetical protein
MRQRLLIIGGLLVLLGSYGLLYDRFGRLSPTPVPRDVPAREQLRILVGLPPGAPLTPDIAQDRLLAELRGSRLAAVQDFLTARGLESDPHAINIGMDENGYHWPITLQQCLPRPGTQQSSANVPDPSIVGIEFVFFPDGDGRLRTISVTEGVNTDAWGC